MLGKLECPLFTLVETQLLYLTTMVIAVTIFLRITATKLEYLQVNKGIDDYL